MSKNWYFNIIKTSKSGIDFKIDPSRFDANTESVVNVDLSKIDNSLSQDPYFYIAPGGKGADPEKVTQLLNFLKSHKELFVPEIRLDQNGQLGVIEGRHRLSFLRDLGYKKIPVIVKKEQEKEIKRRYA